MINERPSPCQSLLSVSKGEPKGNSRSQLTSRFTPPIFFKKKCQRLIKHKNGPVCASSLTYTVPDFVKIYRRCCDVTFEKHKLSHEPYSTTGNSETDLHNKCSKGRFQRHDCHLASVFFKPVTRYSDLNIKNYRLRYYYVFFFFLVVKSDSNRSAGLF